MGEVLLTTSIGNVLRKLRVAVVPDNAPLTCQFPEDHPRHLRKLRRLSQRERSLRIEREGEFGSEALSNLSFGHP